MKKLFECTWEKRVYVMAESREEAQRLADDYERFATPSAPEVYAANSYYQDWKNKVPAGSDDEKTVGEIFGGKKTALVNFFDSPTLLEEEKAALNL
jgi:hypothetical protein